VTLDTARRRPARVVFLRRAQVWNGRRAVVADIQIEGTTITRVRPALSAPEGAQVVDLEGLVVLPGFTDAHIHPLSWSRQLDHVDLTEARSIADVCRALADACATAEPGAWVQAVGVSDGNRLTEARLPHRHELDQVSRRHPIAILGRTQASINSAALDEIGLPPPADAAEVDRDADGEPTGILRRPAALAHVRTRAPQLTPKQELALLQRFLDGLARLGITTVVDYGSVHRGTTFAEDWEPYATLHAAGRLSTRVRVACRIPGGASIADAVAEFRVADPRKRAQDEMLRVGPLKAFADGGVTGALLRGQYAGRPGYVGVRLLDGDDITRLTDYAVEAGWQLSLHALGGAAIDDILAVWSARASRVAGRRFSLQHAFDPSPANMRVCRSLGVVVGIHQSLFYVYGAEMLQAWNGNVGPHLNPVATWTRNGVRLAGGSDIPPHDPLRAIESLAKRSTQARTVIGPDERITRDVAVRLLTVDAAYGTFDEQLFGRVAPGLRADLVVLSDSPADHDGAVTEIERVATLVDGRPTYLSGSAPRSLMELACH
jgi:predicted amidohydrolase YtcJ